jgi:predicted nucleotidyltransferase
MKLKETLTILKEELKPSLTEHCYGISTYGSAARGEDFIEGWSDVDVLVIPKYDFQCPRSFYEEASRWFTRTRERLEEKGADWGIKDEIDLSIYDKGSVESGRYAWMIESFKDHLRRSAKTICGSDVRNILSKEHPKMDEEASLSYSLWTTRSTASTLDYNRKHDEKEFMYDVKKSTKALSNFFRDAVVLKGGKLKSDAKPEIAKQFIEVFPEVNPESVLEVIATPILWPNKLSQNGLLDIFYNGLETREIAVKVLNASLPRFIVGKDDERT